MKVASGLPVQDPGQFAVLDHDVHVCQVAMGEGERAGSGHAGS